MKHPGISRRCMLKAASAVVAGTAFPTRVMADAPPAEPVTPALIEAAKKEGQVIYYTSTDLPVAEKLAKAFEAKYPGIAVRVERTGARNVCSSGSARNFRATFTPSTW
jgi:iron(III) transport system substrate-binding protein